MKDTEIVVKIYRKELLLSALCVLILSRSIDSSSLTFTSAGCSSDLDCSLNGRCVDWKEDNSFLSESYQIRRKSTFSACICDKPWFGEHCEIIRFVPTRGKQQGNHPKALPTAVDVIAAQGYGMTPNITTWGGGILVEPINSTANMYHLYVSRMSNDCPLEHWVTNSRVDHAVSASIAGPYEFSDVAIPTFSHNPAPIEICKYANPEWNYAIFHLGDGNNGTEGGYDCRNTWNNNHVGISETHRRFLRQKSSIDGARANIHVSKSLHGPWVSLLDHNLGKCNNPAPWLHPTNGTLYVLCSQGKSRLFKSELGNISGPYEFVTEFRPGALITAKDEIDEYSIQTAHEDPFLYTDANGNFHIIYHAYQYTGSPEECQDSVVSAHVFSRDGYDWHMGPAPPYGSKIDVSFPDTLGSGLQSTTTVTLASRERPKLLVQEGLITHSVEGVCGAPGCQTTGHAPFCVDCKYLNWDFTLVSALDTS